LDRNLSSMSVHPLDGSVWFTDPTYGRIRRIANGRVDAIFECNRPYSLTFTHDAYLVYTQLMGHVYRSNKPIPSVNEIPSDSQRHFQASSESSKLL
jgi:hypothetical protein